MANGHLVLPGEDDDHHSPDNMSTVSNISDSTSIFLDSADAEPDEVDEISGQEDFEDKLKDCIDGLTQKRYMGLSGVVHIIITDSLSCDLLSIPDHSVHYSTSLSLTQCFTNML